MAVHDNYIFHPTTLPNQGNIDEDMYNNLITNVLS